MFHTDQQRRTSLRSFVSAQAPNNSSEAGGTMVVETAAKPPGKAVKPDDPTVVISKMLSWLLRHGIKHKSVGLNSESADGWVKVTEVLTSEYFKEITKEILMKVIVDSNAQKLRYQLSPDCVYIRAYSRDEKKAFKEGAASTTASVSVPAPPEKKGTLRGEAPEFVPSTSPMLSSMQTSGYPPWPLLYPQPTMMPYVPVQVQRKGTGEKGGGTFRELGRIKSFYDDKGYGFIECPRVTQQFGRDLFVHKAQLNGFKVGDEVTVTVTVNEVGLTMITISHYQKSLAYFGWEQGLLLALGRLKDHEASAWTKALGLLSASGKYLVQPDVVLYNATAAVCGRASHWQWSLHLVDSMLGGRVHADSASLNVLISACGRASRWELALAFTVGDCKLQGQRQLDALGEAKGVGAAIDALGRAGHWRIALSLLDEVRTRSVASIGCFNAAIAAAARSGQWLQAFQCLESVRRFRLTPSAITKGAEIRVLGLGDKGQGPSSLGWQACLTALLQPSPSLNLHVLNASLSTCGRARRWELVHSLLQLMPRMVIVPDALSASAAVSSCASSFKWEHALELRPGESDWKSLALEFSASRSIFVCVPHVAFWWTRSPVAIDFLNNAGAQEDVPRGKEKSQPLHPREDKRSLQDRPAYAFLQNCRQQTVEGLAGYFRDPGDRMGEILELTPAEFTPCAHGAEHEEDDSHKIGELPSTAICGNDITASCFYVVGELSKNAGVFVTGVTRASAVFARIPIASELCKEELKEAMSPQEATSPMKTPVRPPVGLDSLPLLNSSAFEFSLLFDMVVELSGPVFKKKWRKLRRKKQKVEATLLAQLKALVLQCEATGTQGIKGIFVKRVDGQANPGQREPIKWIPHNKLKAQAYFALAKREADKAKTPLAYRSGGGSCLGLIGIPAVQNGSDDARPPQTPLGGKERSVFVEPSTASTASHVTGLEGHFGYPSAS
ncbi:EMB2654 [Symbiodinium sp. KB8]|nr:EMB2654 [Symbiodinium sp. KB8]